MYLKMKLNKDELKSALEVVKPGLASKEIIEQSTSFAFMDGRVVTYNDEISISHPVEGLSIEGAVKAEELYKLLSKLKKDEIEMELTESEVILSSGRMRAGLVLMKEIKLPLEELGDMDGKWKKLPENFVEGLKFAIGSCSSDMSQAILTCVHITNDFMEASDSFRISIYFVKLPVKDVLLPAPSAKHLLGFTPTHILEGTSWVHFKNAAGTILSCRIFEDKFPNTAHIVNVEGESIQFPRTLTEILDRAVVFSKRDHFTDETITVVLGEKRIVISGSSDYGWFEESANIKYTGRAIEFKITPDLLSGILNQSSDCVLSKDRIMFTGENWKYVAMLRV